MMRRVLPALLAVVASAVFAPSALAGFGFNTITGDALNQNGIPDVQAGSHPYEITFSLKMNLDAQGIGEPIKEIEAKLPPGFVADRQAVPRCHQAEATITGCPRDTQIGWLWVNLSGVKLVTPIYNLTAPPQVPVEFGGEIFVANIKVLLDASVRTGGNYAPVVTMHNGASRNISEAQLTLWGTPASVAHDSQRCRLQGGFNEPSEVTCKGGGEASDVPPKPFITLPPSCGEPLTTRVRAVTWDNESETFETSFDYTHNGTEDLALGGCESIGFFPSIETKPESSATDTPTGLDVALRFSQDESVGGVSTGDLKEAVVTLPAGLSVSPSTLNGLTACSEEQIGLASERKPSCPDSSKLASVEVSTPLLETPLHGSLFLAQQGNAGAEQGANPFGSLVAFYLVVEGDGVLVKLPGVASLDPSTGQLTTRFGADPVTGLSGLPELPVSEIKVHFFGGPRAPLVTPSACGTFTTTSQLTPWSAPQAAMARSGFSISSGCSSGGFTPSFTAGTTDSRAGQFSPFIVHFARQDSEQDLGAIQVRTPPGLLGSIANVPLCGEPQAADGTCGAQSEIGDVSASAGAGPDPFDVTGGHAYLTGPYKGAPFGLSIVVPAQGGPYKLEGAGTNGQGDVVVRAAVSIDPRTTALTVTSDPLPQIIEGVPLQVKSVTVDVNRSGFTFNPTDCQPNTISATLQGAQGAIANVSAPFQATSCPSLSFTPHFNVSTSGRTSKAAGASLDVRVVYPQGSQGSMANIRSVRVELPKQLPSRLTTLQQACRATTFNANPASCPTGSVVGIAKATTPLLPAELTGPAYFVSYGAAKFPELIIVLQGDGVRVDLHGETFISKAGITSSTFASIPDAPFGSFELYLPEGKYSALATTANLCKSKLAMPTSFVAQNGAVLKQTTKIAVTGCPKAKNAGRTARARRGRAIHRHGHSGKRNR